MNHPTPAKVKTSLTGPLGSNYIHSCCDKEYNVTNVLNSDQQLSGCESMTHEATIGYNMTSDKAKKVTDRIVAH
jgi:hypothetical protein